MPTGVQGTWVLLRNCLCPQHAVDTWYEIVLQVSLQIGRPTLFRWVLDIVGEYLGKDYCADMLASATHLSCTQGCSRTRMQDTIYDCGCDDKHDRRWVLVFLLVILECMVLFKARVETEGFVAEFTSVCCLVPLTSTTHTAHFTVLSPFSWYRLRKGSLC